MTTPIIIISIGLLVLCAVQIIVALQPGHSQTRRLQLQCGLATILLNAIALFLWLHGGHGIARELAPVFGVLAGYVYLFPSVYARLEKRKEARREKVTV